MTTQETEKNVDEKEEVISEKKTQNNATAEKTQAVLKEMMNIFSLQNLTVSLLSALLVISASMGTYYISQYFQKQFEKNPEFLQTMSTSLSLSLIIIMMLVAVIPGLIYCLRTKKWINMPYILLLEIAFIAIFFTTMYFFAPKEDPTYMQNYQNYLQQPTE